MTHTRSDDPAHRTIRLLKHVIDRPRLVLAEWIDPPARTLRPTECGDKFWHLGEYRMCPAEYGMFVFGGWIKGPRQIWGDIWMDLIIGDMTAGRVRPQLCAVIPPRQRYYLKVPVFDRWESDDGKFLGQIRLFGWHFNDDEYRTHCLGLT